MPIKALLIDLSGTLHIESTPLPGAVRALQRLRASGIPFRFCSNTSKESTDSLCQRLRRIGFDLPLETQHKEVWTSLGAVRRVLEDRGLKRFGNFSPSSTRSFLLSVVLPDLTLFCPTPRRRSALQNSSTGRLKVKATTLWSSACLRHTCTMMSLLLPSAFSKEKHRTPAGDWHHRL